MAFQNKKEYEQWIEEQDWYQTMDLPSGVHVEGKAPTDRRKALFETVDFQDKSVLDVGCNSGQYCFWAKDRGATSVLGVDVDTKRIGQARTLAENEGYDVTFEERGVFDIDEGDRADIVLCIAVLTEIGDTFGAIEQLKRVIGERAYIELDIAKPIVYLSHSKNWLRGYANIPRHKAVTEVRQIKSGEWVVSPSLAVLQAIFGKEFRVTYREPGVRYDVVEVVRTSEH